MKIGDFRLSMLRSGDLRLDGGAMFGVVPRVLWQQKFAPDVRNRIGMTMNVLLVQAGDMNLLVDTGSGGKEDEAFQDMYGLSPSRLTDKLAEAGLSPEDVDVVFNTHLHFDHAGGNTRFGEGGEITATFPNARYLVQKAEYEDAMAPHARNRASYFEANYRPLYEEGRLELLDGEAEIAPGLRALPLPGHTRGMQGLFIESGGEKALYLADCVPTSHHVPYPWIMAYDLYPMTTLETKQRVLPQAAKEGWTLFFEHDPSVPAARIEEGKPGRFRVESLIRWEGGAGHVG